MIATIRGVVVDTLPGAVVIEVAGIGYEVRVPVALLGAFSEGKEVYLYTHHYIREDTSELYGFESLEAKMLFEQLISVSGVGPKVAIAIMSGLGLEALQQAIATGNSDTLQSVSGVGKKMAARIIIDLKNRISQGEAAALLDEKSSHALDALKQLGFSGGQARTALAQVPASAKTEEEVIRSALKLLGK